MEGASLLKSIADIPLPKHLLFQNSRLLALFQGHSINLSQSLFSF
jgi:hypothetical protein